jgi:hypothetical protein
LFALSYTFGKGLIDLARGEVVDYFELLAEFRGLFERKQRFFSLCRLFKSLAISRCQTLAFVTSKKLSAARGSMGCEQPFEVWSTGLS